MTSPLDTRPQTVAIVALGPSSHSFFCDAVKKKDPLRVDEVWCCNSAIDVICAEKAWIMDDLKRIEKRYPDWGSRLKLTKTPIITCRAYDDYPTSVAYPLEDVFNTIKDDTFSTTVAYMVAYAIHIEVDTLYLFGCDYHYPGNNAVEAGASDVAYLLGIAKGKGMTYRIPQTSTLLNCHITRFDEKGNLSRPLYGYDFNPGDSIERIRKGKGTEFDKKIAAFAPHAFPDAKPQKADGELKPPAKPSESEIPIDEGAETDAARAQ